MYTYFYYLTFQYLILDYLKVDQIVRHIKHMQLEHSLN